MKDLIGKHHEFENGIYRVVHIAKHTETDDLFAVYGNGGNLGFYFMKPFLDVVDQETVKIVSLSDLRPPAETYWDHFKSTLDEPRLYVNYGESKVLNNLEEFVLYSPLYMEGKEELESLQITCLARPKDNFHGNVVSPDYIGPRFREFDYKKHC